MARCRWLRRVDLLSTVSGGGYIGSFLGRWFDRLRPPTEWGGARRTDAGGSRSHRARAERSRLAGDALAAPSTATTSRRRGTATPAPTPPCSCATSSASIFVVGALLFALFGAVDWVRYGLFDPAFAIAILGNPPASTEPRDGRAGRCGRR